MYSNGSDNGDFLWVNWLERREPSVFMVAISTLVTTVKLVLTCRTLHMYNLFIVGARLINAEWARITSAVRVCKVMVLRVLDVEKSDVIGALGCIYHSTRREVYHSTPERVVRAPRSDVACWGSTIV